MPSNGDVQSSVIRMRGLPFDVTPETIVEFFEGCAVKDGQKGVHLTRDGLGRPSGEAYVEFDTVDDAKSAMQFDRKHIGKRYVELFPSNENEMKFVLPRSGSDSSLREPVLRMRGLPFSADFASIREFFHGYTIVKDGILMVYNDSGKPSGEAYVQFTAPDVAMRAMSKNKENMGHRYIELFPSSMGEAYAEANRQQSLQQMYSGDYAGIGAYGDYQQPGVGYAGPPGYPGGPMAMGGRVAGGPMRGGPRAGGPMPMRPGLGRPSPYQAGPPAGRRFGSSGKPGSDWASRTGYWVHMRGLPYSATEQEIAEFFAPLSIAHVELHYNAAGLPSGEADVDFYNGEDAASAMAKDKQHMGPRYIDLFLHQAPDSGAGPVGFGNGGGGVPGLMPGGGGGFGGAAAGAGFGGPMGVAPRGAFRGGMGGGGGMGRGGGAFKLHLRGLPWSAGEREIVNFFYPLQPARVNVLPDASGRSSGEADVFFNTADEQQKALARNGDCLGTRYIEIFLRY
ncbi:hypothetical protein BOX15_Mlig015426g2 [Macrostomum lignano]|uniref:RRM domain-containing protein n=2 Tax=Macrostomum lignano TaxID=282301 RepID=A0A1I8HGL9_9PLAT|nr:hypothetical protein BOX15_Mlig015426g2 [Macrostomum lignano]